MAPSSTDPLLRTGLAAEPSTMGSATNIGPHFTYPE